MKQFTGRTAVITGAGSGFGLETSRIAARRGMNVVMADVQADALERAAAEIEALGAKVLAQRLDVSRAAEVDMDGAGARIDPFDDDLVGIQANQAADHLVVGVVGRRHAEDQPDLLRERRAGVVMQDDFVHGVGCPAAMLASCDRRAAKTSRSVSPRSRTSAPARAPLSRSTRCRRGRW